MPCFWGKVTEKSLLKSLRLFSLKTGNEGVDGEEEEGEGEQWEGQEGGRNHSVARGTSAHLLECVL